MSLGYRISPEARDDIDAAYSWYESQADGRGDAFLVELTGMIADLRITPEIYGRVRGGTRAALLATSNYVVYYRVEADRIRVTAVRHASADPRKWQRRK